MRILALDISSTSTGWAIVEDGQLRNSGVVKGKDSLDSMGRSYQIGYEIQHCLVNEAEVDRAVFESSFMLKNAKTSHILGFAQGAVTGKLTPFVKSRKFDTLAPASWKTQFCEKAMATKDDILSAIEMYTPEGYHTITSDDEADACAMGLVYYQICKQEQRELEALHIETPKKLKKSRKKVA